MDKTTIKATLFNAGRYAQVTAILSLIVKETAKHYGSDVPVVAHDDGSGHISFRVDTEDLVNGASKLQSLIDSKVSRFPFSNDLDALYYYIDTEIKMIMNNYMVSITHRKEPEEDVEKLRVYMIIKSLIESNDVTDEWEWSIPEGWKRKFDSHLI